MKKFRNTFNFGESFKIYIEYFGLHYFLLVIFLVIAQLFFVEFFPYILIGIIVSLFLYDPLKLIYKLIGAKSSLRAFLILFIATQLLFAWAYSAYLYPNYSFSELVFNTFCTALTQQPAHIFDDFITKYHTWAIYGNVYILLNTQIFISWIYLGVLIAGLYQKLRNE